jgi:hypothetical protein
VHIPECTGGIPRECEQQVHPNASTPQYHRWPGWQECICGPDRQLRCACRRAAWKRPGLCHVCVHRALSVVWATLVHVEFQAFIYLFKGATAPQIWSRYHGLGTLKVLGQHRSSVHGTSFFIHSFIPWRRIPLPGQVRVTSWKYGACAGVAISWEVK